MPTLSAQVRPLVGDAVQHARACKKDPRCARRRRVAELQESVTMEDAPGPGNEGQAREHIDPAQQLGLVLFAPLLRATCEIQTIDT